MTTKQTKFPVGTRVKYTTYDGLIYSPVIDCPPKYQDTDNSDMVWVYYYDQTPRWTNICNVSLDEGYQPVVEAKVEPKIEQWEYKYFTEIDLNTTVYDLNNLGKQGWEVCASASGGWLLKRKVQNDN